MRLELNGIKVLLMLTKTQFGEFRIILPELI